MYTRELDNGVGAGINVAGFTPIRTIVTCCYVVNAQSRIHSSDIFMHIPGDRVPAADYRCPCVYIVPADRVRVAGEATDEVSGVSNTSLDEQLHRSCGWCD